MKQKLLFILILLGILFTVSCSKDEMDDPTLTLSETGTIDFPKATSEKTVTVTTNQTEWTAVTNAEWTELILSGKTLTIKALENTTTVSRKADITVMAGGLGRKLLITQSGSNITIVTIPDKLEINQWGGTYQFDVNANTKDWTVTSDADWVKVTPRQFKSEVMIEVAENVKREARVAKLTLAGDGNKSPKEFTITQSGIMYYIMPYLKMGASLTELQAFETARKSEMTQDINAILGGPYTFRTKSSAFPSIVYTFTTEKLSAATLNSVLKKEELESAELDKMLTDNNFKLINKTTTSKVYEQDLEKVTLRATVSLANNGKIVFTATPRQTQDYPTFDTMPYGFTDFTASKATVMDWEPKNGGKYDVVFSDPAQGFIAFKAPLPWIIRSYIFETKPTLIQTMNFIPKITYVYFEYEGQYLPTKEFSALIKNEGFQYAGAGNTGLQFYDNSTKNLRMGIKVAKYSNVNGGEPTIEMRFSPIPKKSGENIAPFKDDNVVVSEISNVLQHKAILF